MDEYKIKIVAALVAVLVWLYVVTENTYEYSVEVPIHPVNLDAGHVIENDIPRVATVRVLGKGRALLTLFMRRDARLLMNLNRLDARGRMVLSPEDVLLPTQGKSIRASEVVSPDTLYVNIVPRKERKLPLKSRLEVQPANGYVAVGGVTLIPDSVLVSGPIGIVDTLSAAYTEDRRLKHTRRNVNTRLRVMSHASGKLSFTPSEVAARVDIQKTGQRELSGVPVEVLRVPPGHQITVMPATARIQLEGGREYLDGLKVDSFRVYIDYKRHGGGQDNTDRTTRVEKDVPAYLDLPASVRALSVEPRFFTLVIEQE